MFKCTANSLNAIFPKRTRCRFGKSPVKIQRSCKPMHVCGLHLLFTVELV